MLLFSQQAFGFASLSVCITAETVTDALVPGSGDAYADVQAGHHSAPVETGGVHISGIPASLRYQPPRPPPSPPPNQPPTDQPSPGHYPPIDQPFPDQPPVNKPPIDNSSNEEMLFGFPLQTLIHIWFGTIFVLVVAFFISLFATRRKKKPARPRRTSAAGISELAFTGKLDLYVIIGTIDNYTGDLRPRTFKLSHSRRVSVQTLLKKCRLSNTFPGSDRIYFKADEYGSLQLINGSNCAILVGSDRPVKNKPYVIRHKGNVRIRDTYKVSELVISPRFLYRDARGKKRKR